MTDPSRPDLDSPGSTELDAQPPQGSEEAIDELAGDQLDDALASLTTHDVGPWRAQHARRRAVAALEAGPKSPLAHAWDRVLEPGLVGAVCLAQLVWIAFALDGLW